MDTASMPPLGGPPCPMVEEALMRGVQRLYAMERGMVAVFDEMGGKLQHPRIAVNAVMLMEIADRHLLDLERFGEERGWRTHGTPCPFAEAWRKEVEEDVLLAGASPLTDALGLALLRNAVHMKLPRYESLRILAKGVPRSGMDQTLRMAAEDERHADERLLEASNAISALSERAIGSHSSTCRGNQRRDLYSCENE